MKNLSQIDEISSEVDLTDKDVTRQSWNRVRTTRKGIAREWYGIIYVTGYPHYPVNRIFIDIFDCDISHMGEL